MSRRARRTHFLRGMNALSGGWPEGGVPAAIDQRLKKMSCSAHASNAIPVSYERSRVQLCLGTAMFFDFSREKFHSGKAALIGATTDSAKPSLWRYLFGKVGRLVARVSRWLTLHFVLGSE